MEQINDNFYGIIIRIIYENKYYIVKQGYSCKIEIKTQWKEEEKLENKELILFNIIILFIEKINELFKQKNKFFSFF